jgi:hypothetical protein
MSLVGTSKTQKVTLVFVTLFSFINFLSRSVPFFIGVFVLAILDCTCTIVFLTYIGKFRQNYVTALYIGEGISSLLPSLFALAQGTGSENKCSIQHVEHNSTLFKNVTESITLEEEDSSRTTPRFSVSVYFWLLFFTLLISFLSFAIMDLVPYFKKFRGELNDKSKTNEWNDLNENENFLIQNNRVLKNQESTSAKTSNYRKPFRTQRGSKKDKILLLTAITLVSFLLYG